MASRSDRASDSANSDREVELNFEAAEQRTEMEKLKHELDVANERVRRAERAVIDTDEREVALRQRIETLQKDQEQMDFNARQQMISIREKERENQAMREETFHLREQFKNMSMSRRDNRESFMQRPAPRDFTSGRVIRTDDRNISPSVSSARYDVPMPRSNVFDGESSWEGFIHPFRSLATTCNWDRDERLFRLTSALRGSAAEFAFTQLSAETLKSYESLEQALEARFKEHKTIASYLAELESRKLGHREKLAEYVADIKRLVLKSFPTADLETRETINLRYFLKGLNDQAMAVAVGMKDPRSIEEARIALETYRSLQDEVGKSKVRQVSQQYDGKRTRENEEKYVTEESLRTLVTN